MPLNDARWPQVSERVAKMDAVIGMLAEEGKWCKCQLRSYDGRRCILGAMMAADASIALKWPILQAIAEVTGRDHLRIEMFNDHPLTTHADVVAVLHRARENILLNRVRPPKPRITPAPPTLWQRIARRAWPI